MDRQNEDFENIFEKCIFDERLVSWTQKKFLHLNNNKQPDSNTAEDQDGHGIRGQAINPKISAENMQTATNYGERQLLRHQGNANQNFHEVPRPLSEWLKPPNLRIPTAGEDAEQWQLSFTAGGDAARHSRCRRQFGSFSQSSALIINIWPSKHAAKPSVQKCYRKLHS